MDVQAGVDDTDGVDGGVPPNPRDPFGELLLNADTGDGILYLDFRDESGQCHVNWIQYQNYSDMESAYLLCSKGTRSASS